MLELASLHQKIIHFPIAFLAVYPFIELVGLIRKSEFIDKLSIIILSIGLFGLILALITGNSNLELYKNLSDIEMKILNEHIFYANYTAWFSGILFLIRIYFSKKIKTNIILRVMFVLISIIVLYFIFKTGEYGGLTNEIISNYKINHQI